MIRNPSGVGTYDFSNNPVDINIERSQFPMSFSAVQTMNAGYLVPYRPIEVLPGDSFKIRLKDITRMATPAVPVMDDCYKDFYAFFVPRRLVWEHWSEFCGENKTGYWAQTTEYRVPHVKCQQGGEGLPDTPVFPKSVLDYMGVPVGVMGISVDACYSRAYALVWNEYFRDQNLMPAAAVPLTDSDADYPVSGDAWLTAALGGDLLPVCKFHDYFTSALPGPQKALNAVSVPVSGVRIINDEDSVSRQYFTPHVYNGLSGQKPTSNYTVGVQALANYGALRQISNEPSGMTGNVYFSLTGTGGSITVNDMRTGFAIQRMYEKMARSGTRYRELLKAFFGVSNGDDRMQVPEYLGHIRTRINMQQVVQTSGSNISGSDTPQGNTAAYSLTGTDDLIVDRGFTEHGILLIVCCIRQRHTYQQGIPAMFSRRKFTEFYLPTFAHLGEQPILNKEIYATGGNSDNQTFGFKEAWSEYRYNSNYVAGECRSSFPQSLDIWHYADDYDKLPTLTADWIAEDASGISRSLAVKTHDQFIASTYFEVQAARPMPIHSIPGMIDHY